MRTPVKCGLHSSISVGHGELHLPSGLGPSELSCSPRPLMVSHETAGGGLSNFHRTVARREVCSDHEVSTPKKKDPVPLLADAIVWQAENVPKSKY